MKNSSSVWARNIAHNRFACVAALVVSVVMVALRYVPWPAQVFTLMFASILLAEFGYLYATVPVLTTRDKHPSSATQQARLNLVGFVISMSLLALTGSVVNSDKGFLVVSAGFAFFVLRNAWKLGKIVVGQFLPVAPGWSVLLAALPVGTLTGNFLIQSAALPPFIVLVIAFASAGYWLASRRFTSQAPKQNLFYLNKLGENIAGHLGQDSAQRWWVHGHQLFASWPYGAEYTPGAEITARTVTGWQGTELQLRAIERQTGLLLKGTWKAVPKPTSNHVVIIRQPDPVVLPNRVTYTFDPEGDIELVPIGVDKDGKPVVCDMRVDTPHILVSAPTGCGKSSILSLVIAHFAGHGGTIDVCDPKRVSFSHLRDLPMIRIASDSTTMVATIASFRHDMEARYVAMHDERISLYNGPPRLLVIDELGSFRDLMLGAGQPGKDALTNLKVILWQGRQARYHVVVAAQQANVKVLGDTDARGQFGFKIATGPTSDEAKKMMFGAGVELPTSLGRIKGRAVVGIGDDLVACQLAVIDPQQACRIAAAGRGQVTPVDNVDNGTPRASAREQDHDHVSTSQNAHVSTSQFVAVEVDDSLDADWYGGRPKIFTVTCNKCGHSFQTATLPGGYTKCHECRKSICVPE